jgi:hypothetical protein
VEAVAGEGEAAGVEEAEGNEDEELEGAKEEDPQ